MVGVTAGVVTVVVVNTVAAVVVSGDVVELFGALLAGGGLPVVTVGTWFVVGTVSSLVTAGGGGSVGAPVLVARVAPGFVGAVDTVEGGTEVVDVTRSVVDGSSACSAATVTSGCGVFGSAVTEVAPDGRRRPPAVCPTEPTWA